MAATVSDGRSQVLTADHDVIAVRQPTAHGALCKVFVDGVSAGTAAYRNGRLSITGEYPESSYQAVARAVALVLGQ